jgi:hypothetical protein
LFVACGEMQQRCQWTVLFGTKTTNKKSARTK